MKARDFDEVGGLLRRRECSRSALDMMRGSNKFRHVGGVLTVQTRDEVGDARGPRVEVVLPEDLVRATLVSSIISAEQRLEQLGVEVEFTKFTPAEEQAWAR